MNDVKIGDTFRGIIGVAAFADGSAVAADSTPTIVILDQGSAMGYAPTFVSKATGLYEVPIVASVGNGFTVGHEYTAYAVVIVGGKTARSPIAGSASFRVVSATGPDVNIASVSTDAIAAAGIKADAVTKIVAGVFAYSHEAGRSVLGVMRRLDGLMTGQATGLNSALATFYRADGTTKVIEFVQDVVAGTRTMVASLFGAD